MILKIIGSAMLLLFGGAMGIITGDFVAEIVETTRKENDCDQNKNIV